MKKILIVVVICFNCFIFVGCDKNLTKQENLMSYDIQTKIFTGELSSSKTNSIDIKVNEWLKENNVIVIEIRYDYEISGTGPHSSLGLCYIVYKKVK